jgi:hypothetical protein
MTLGPWPFSDLHVLEYYYVKVGSRRWSEDLKYKRMIRCRDGKNMPSKNMKFIFTFMQHETRLN